MCSICGNVHSVHEDSLVSTDVYVTTSAKPVASLAEAVRYLTTQWPGQVGMTRTWTGATAISYAISSSASETGSQESAGFKAMSPAMRAAAREAFELWNDLIVTDLNETTSAAANISFAYSDRTIGNGNYTRTYTSYTGTTDQKITGAHVWLNAGTRTHDTDADLYYGGYGRLTYVH